MLFLALSVLVVDRPVAQACSCAPVDPIDAVAAASVVFAGSPGENVGDDGRAAWEFDVDGVIKGDVASTELVTGDDWLGGCGRNFSAFADERIVVYADGRSGSLHARGCAPMPTADNFESLLRASLDYVAAAGSPVAVVGGRIGAANLHIVNADGGVVARADLDIEVGAVAHCSGTTNLVVQSRTGQRSAIVDLVTLTATEVEDQSGFGKFASFGDDQFTCVGDAQILAVSGAGDNGGTTAVRTLDTRTGAGVNRFVNDVGRAIPHRSGTVIVLPWEVGADLSVLAGDDLVPVAAADLDLGNTVSTVNGAVSSDWAELAILATVDGSRVEYDTGATHLITVALAEGLPVSGSVRRIELPVGAAGIARAVGYVDDATLVVERESGDGKSYDFINSNGEFLADQDLDWGSGLSAIDGEILRASNGGIQFVGRSGSRAASSLPPAQESYSFRSLRVAVLDDVPVIEFDVEPVAEMSIQPVAAVGETNEVDVSSPVVEQQAIVVTSADDTTDVGDVAVSDVDDLLDPNGTNTSGGSDPLPTGLIVGLGVVALVFVLGLNAIHKQRKSGRTSKFPRIG